MGIKKIYIWVMVIMVVIVGACTDSNVNLPEESNVPEGYVRIGFTAEIPDMDIVDSRAVDPDGVDISRMTLFCFNQYGLFISTAEATLTPNSTDPSTSGKYNATIPADTYIIHFVANQPRGMYSEDDLLNKTEDEINATMEGASGMIIYWARFEYDPTLTDNNGNVVDIVTQLKTVYTPAVKLIRNQAKVSIPEWESSNFIVTGFVVANIHAFGTVAPYHPINGFPTQRADNDNSWWPGTDSYVTLPKNTTMMSDIEDVNTKEEDYIFEHENTMNNPVSVIIRGYNTDDMEKKELYYHALLLDSNGDLIKVRRNHWYKLHITDKLSYGSSSFAQAMEGPATNNVWATVESWVNEVSDGTYTLSVEKTGVTLSDNSTEYKNRSLTLRYTLKDNNGNTVPGGADISWFDGNNVAQNVISNHSYSGTSGEFTLNLLSLAEGNQVQTGTLLIKKGFVQRTVKVAVLRTQKFTPCWIDTQVYGGTTGNNITLMFNIPDDCPDIMFPFKVLLSVNALDVRSETGQVLPVVRKGEEGYFGEDYNGIGYKYEYTVTASGVQRVYFENILANPTVDESKVYIEAEYFQTVTKTFVMATHNNVISFQPNTMMTYTMADGVVGQGDIVYYRLVPQKINANVQIDMELTSNGTAINAGVNDEFLLYSQNLDAYTDDELRDRGITKICNFYQVDENYWQSSTNGRVVMFKPMNSTATNTGNYSVFMKTNRSVSAEVVRIASNAAGQNSALPGNTANAYAGNSYRSVVFELANYRPFRFAAQVNGIGNFKDNSVTDDEEVVDDIELTYVPEQQVNLSLDVTSFEGTDGNSVDPFGTEFEIYIDAPMLKIDESRLAECKLNGGKLYVDPAVEGRFVYKVDSSRETERNYGTDDVKNTDSKATSQSGERKTLPFLTKYIVSSGEIKISSNKDKVVYFDKTFEVSNTPIEGSITYGGTNVPKDAFVAFALVRNGARIGSMTITADGKYSLKLRKEYSFNWYNGEIEVSYIYNNSGTKTVYTATIPNLASLYANPNIALTTQTSTGG